MGTLNLSSSFLPLILSSGRNACCKCEYPDLTNSPPFLLQPSMGHDLFMTMEQGPIKKSQPNNMIYCFLLHINSV